MSTTQTAAEFLSQVAGIVNFRVAAPSISGQWLVWEQTQSKGIHDKTVAALKAAGIPAFFKAGERRWGVKAPWQVMEELESQQDQAA